ncbi:hypothetical protein DFH28DRAFT_1132669 [Melampsora americana]|nr:hypothetical protein DFH28DRAFT_1132669 [Melampsora americana]
MEYTPSPLSGDAYDPLYHQMFKTTSIPENIRRRIRTRCSKLPPPKSNKGSRYPSRPLAKILLSRRRHLKHELLEFGKCEGLGPCSVTVSLDRRVQGSHPATHFSPQHRLTIQRAIFFAPGLVLHLMPDLEYVLPKSEIAEMKKRKFDSWIMRLLHKGLARFLGLQLRILTNEGVFRLLVQAFRNLLEDDRCPSESKAVIKEWIEGLAADLLISELDI